MYMCMCNIRLSPGTMKATVMSVLLCLLSALVEVHSQTVPYVSFMGTSLPNHSYVNLTLVGTDGKTVYIATLTWRHAVMELRVLTVETGTFLMERDCHLMVMMLTCMSFVMISKLTCIIGTMLTHLVHIAVELRPMQSTMTKVGRRCV